MPHDYYDEEDRAPPFNTNIVSEQGVDTSPQYTAPIPANQTVRGYKSTAVMVYGNGTAVTVEVGWKIEDDIGANVITESQTGGGSAPDTLLFVNKGQILAHVKLTGGNDTDYSVVESNQLPLPDREAWPSHQNVSLPGMFEFGWGGGVGHALVLDTACYHNFYYETVNQDSFVSFYFVAGPQYARHEIIFTGLKGPNMGIQRYLLASIRPDAQADLGYDNPRELMEAPAASTSPPTFVDFNASVDRYQAAIQRNVTWGINFRVSGRPGAQLTAIGIDSDGFPSGDGGPGLYLLKILMDTKNGLSAGYRARWQEIGIHRIGDSGFP